MKQLQTQRLFRVRRPQKLRCASPLPQDLDRLGGQIEKGVREDAEVEHAGDAAEDGR